MVDYRKLKIAAKYLLIGSIVLLLITKLSYLLQGNSSPARWLYLGSHSIQTSDIARLAMIIFLAAYMDHYRDQIKDFYNGFAPPIGIIAVVMVLIVIQPDFSTAAIIGLIGFMILFVGGARISHLLATGAASLLILTPIMLMKPYRIQRILTYIYGESAGVEESYQIKQSLISLGNGGFIGLGLGNSLGKNLFLPTPHTDFIFAIIGEELGFIGVVLVILLFSALIYKAFSIGKKAQQSSKLFAAFFAYGLGLLFAGQTMINVGASISLLPVKGLTLPFLSYGGASLIMSFFMIGLLVRIQYEVECKIEDKAGAELQYQPP
jgi:cell division protein FtsW